MAMKLDGILEYSLSNRGFGATIVASGSRNDRRSRNVDARVGSGWEKATNRLVGQAADAEF